MTTAETKTCILDTAERLFARDGFTATSLRAITEAAGVNIAAVNYHFGSKEGLITEVMKRRLRPVNERRIAELSVLKEHLKLGGTAPSIKQVLRAFLAPPFEKLHEWEGDDARNFATLISRVHYEASPDVRETILHDFEHVLKQFRDVIHRAEPALPENRVNLRLLFVVGAMAYTLAWVEKLDVLSVENEDSRRLLDELIAFASGGVSAPAPSPHSE